MTKTKLFVTLFTTLALALLVGCSSGGSTAASSADAVDVDAAIAEATADLEGQVADLEGQVADLQAQLSEAGAGAADAAADAAASVAAALPEGRDTTKSFKDAEDKDQQCSDTSFSVDCSAITIGTNLQDYLGRDDVVYIDLRDYSDYAKTHFRNFECVPYFALIKAMEDSEEPGTQLYYGTVAEPKAAYEESGLMLRAMIPDDKTVFLMCQSGGRVNMCMQLLAAEGYDMSKIYNVGGMAQAEGNSALNDYLVSTGEITTDVAYSFEGLTPAA